MGCRDHDGARHRAGKDKHEQHLIRRLARRPQENAHRAPCHEEHHGERRRIFGFARNRRGIAARHAIQGKVAAVDRQTDKREADPPAHAPFQTDPRAEGERDQKPRDRHDEHGRARAVAVEPKLPIREPGVFRRWVDGGRNRARGAAEGMPKANPDPADRIRHAALFAGSVGHEADEICTIALGLCHGAVKASFRFAACRC